MTDVATAVERARTEAMATVVESGFTMDGLSEVFVQSGFFKDVKAKSQAIVKILLGRELGLKPIQAMLSINMVQGRPEVAAATLGALVKRSGKYDYRIKEHTHEVCEIEYFSVTAGKLDHIGSSRFEMEDARRAGLDKKDNYKAWPKNMMFARAMSNGVRWYCLDAIGGMPVYVEGEIAEITPADDTPPDEYGGMEPKEREEAGHEPTDMREAREQAQAERTDIGNAADVPLPGREPAPPQEVTPAMSVPDPACVFELNGVQYQTKGITKELLLDTFKLVPQVNKKKGKKYAEGLLETEFGVKTRKDLTLEEAEKYIARLKELLEAE